MIYYDEKLNHVNLLYLRDLEKIWLLIGKWKNLLVFKFRKIYSICSLICWEKFIILFCVSLSAETSNECQEHEYLKLTKDKFTKYWTFWRTEVLSNYFRVDFLKVLQRSCISFSFQKKFEAFCIWSFETRRRYLV